MTPKHTPLPWKCDEPANWHYLSARIYHENEGRFDPIAQVHLSGCPRHVGLANAALIVRAVNCHDEMKDLLKSAIGGISYLAEAAGVNVAEWKEWDAKARAALAKATEPQ